MERPIERPDEHRAEHRVPLYDDFGERYDLMVEWPGRLARESPFFEALCRELGARRLLDAGCGTGWHAAHFARLGLAVVAADPSAEMLRLARAEHGTLPGLRFVQAGLGELRPAVEGLAGAAAPADFDVAVCLGNTLPHLPDDAALRRALADLAATLRPGGALVVQQLNYDRILAERRRFLGLSSRTTPTAEHLFFRFYDYHTAAPPAGGAPPPVERLTFNLVAFERRLGPDAAGRAAGGEPARGEWRYRVDATTLQPILTASLAAALAASGFGEVRLLGDYHGAAFDPASSGDLVVVARRAASP